MKDVLTDEDFEIPEDKFPMDWQCENCGEEIEIWVDRENPDIDPPYYCRRCENLFCEENEE